VGFENESASVHGTLEGNEEPTDSFTSSTREPRHTVISENFDIGWGQFQHWTTGNGYIGRGATADDNSLGYSGSTVFMYGDNDRQWEQCVLSMTVDLTYFNEVSLEFYYASEDIENGEYCCIDIDNDANPNNGYSHQRWRTLTTPDDGDWATTKGDYSFQKYDLTGIGKNSNAIIRFRGVFQTSTSGGNIYDMLAIDNVSLKVSYKPVLSEKLSVSPPGVYTIQNDTAVLNFTFADPDDHDINDFLITVDFKIGDNVTQKRFADNISLKDARFDLIKNSTGSYNGTIMFDPPPDYGFGFLDAAITIFDPEGGFNQPSYWKMADVVELKNWIPIVDNSSVMTDRSRVNVLNPGPISFSGRCTDLDNETHSDYSLSISIRDELNNTYDILTEGANGEGQVTFLKNSSTLYDLGFQWTPDVNYPASLYDILIQVEDENGGLGELDYEKLPDAFELYEANIDDVYAEPAEYNRNHGTPVHINFTIIENISSGYDLRNVDVEISLKSTNGTVYPICNTDSRNDVVEVVELDQNSFMISYRYESAHELPDDDFDARIRLVDGDDTIFISGYYQNPDVLVTYYNINPEILSIGAFPDTLNIFHRPSVTLSVTFTDPDLPIPGEFSCNVTVRGPLGNTFEIYGQGKTGDADVQFTHLEGDIYMLNCSFEVNNTYAMGSYDAQVWIYDRYMSHSRLTFSSAPDVFELFYNHPPSPPNKLLPDETRDTSPLLHWYGASDTKTETMDLSYYIRIGTSPGTDDILPWQWVGKNPFYQIEKVLPYDTYHVEIMANDGVDNSTPLRENIDVFILANLPPLPPNDILPDFTMETLPKITWSGAGDGDGDTIKNNYIQIGTYSYGNDTFSWVDVGPNEQYQVYEELPFGTYYVQIKVSDGHSMSYIYQELMHIVGEGNAPPAPPTEMYPTSTWNTMPKISWVGAYDINNDTLSYALQMGSSPGMGDVIPWEEGIGENSYQVENELGIGKYYVQIKAYDGEFFSVVFEALLEITEIGNVPPLPVTNITPSVTINTTPMIRWDPAVDPDGDDTKLVYFIQIGLSKGHGDKVSWFPTQNFTKYALSVELAPNRIYFVQVKAFDGEGYSPVAYGTLEVIRYITEISFETGKMHQRIEKGTSYSFNIRVVNRGTIDDNVTIAVNAANELLPFIKLDKDHARLSPDMDSVVTLELYIPENEKILGNFSIEVKCTSKVPTFFSVTEPSLIIEIVEKEDPELPFFEMLMEEKRLEMTIALIFLVLVIVLVIILLVVRRIKNRIPAELLDREKEFKGDVEITFIPQVRGGVVTKKVMPDVGKILKGDKDTLQLPEGKAGADKALPAQKKRLALPQYSVVIDMNTKQVLGQSETKDISKDESESGEVLDFLFVDGKYELQTESVPSAHPYQPPSTTPGVPIAHPYKVPPTAGAPTGQPGTGTHAPPSAPGTGTHTPPPAPGAAPGPSPPKGGQKAPAAPPAEGAPKQVPDAPMPTPPSA